MYLMQPHVCSHFGGVASAASDPIEGDAKQPNVGGGAWATTPHAAQVLSCPGAAAVLQLSCGSSSYLKQAVHVLHTHSTRSVRYFPIPTAWNISEYLWRLRMEEGFPVSQLVRYLSKSLERLRKLIRESDFSYFMPENKLWLIREIMSDAFHVLSKYISNAM